MMRNNQIIRETDQPSTPTALGSTRVEPHDILCLLLPVYNDKQRNVIRCNTQV